MQRGARSGSSRASRLTPSAVLLGNLHRGGGVVPLQRLPPQTVEVPEVRLERPAGLAVVADIDEHEGALPAQHLLDERGA